MTRFVTAPLFCNVFCALWFKTLFLALKKKIIRHWLWEILYLLCCIFALYRDRLEETNYLVLPLQQRWEDRITPWWWKHVHISWTRTLWSLYACSFIHKPHIGYSICKVFILFKWESHIFIWHTNSKSTSIFFPYLAVHLDSVWSSVRHFDSPCWNYSRWQDYNYLWTSLKAKIEAISATVCRIKIKHFSF